MIPKTLRTTALSKNNIPDNKVGSLDFSICNEEQGVGIVCLGYTKNPKSRKTQADAETFGRAQDRSGFGLTRPPAGSIMEAVHRQIRRVICMMAWLPLARSAGSGDQDWPRRRLRLSHWPEPQACRRPRRARRSPAADPPAPGRPQIGRRPGAWVTTLRSGSLRLARAAPGVMPPAHPRLRVGSTPSRSLVARGRLHVTLAWRTLSRSDTERKKLYLFHSIRFSDEQPRCASLGEWVTWRRHHS